MGQVLQAGQGQIPSRQAQIKAGIPKEVSSETINKVCASGIRAAGILDAAIRAGDLEVAVGGGMESMSNAPYLLKGARFGFRMGDGKAIDAMINDGLTNPFSGKHMAHEASEVADELEMTRADMDRWALRSHELAIKATDEGRLPEEIVPVTVKGRKGDTVVEVDEGPRRDSCLRRCPSCRRLPQGRQPHGRQRSGRQRRRRRPGPSPPTSGQGQRQDGAGDDHRPGAGRRRLPLPRPHPGQGGAEGAGKAGLTAEDIDLWEINEAFASVTLNSMRMLGIDEDKVNVNGGAVALGHPIGASGARILGTLVTSCAAAAAARAAPRSAPAAARATR